MEWVLEGRRPEAVSALRREVMDHLRRHADRESDFAGAEVVVAELVANAFKHAPGPAWVRIEWGGERPRLEVHDLGPGFELAAVLPPAGASRGRGLLLVDALAGDLAREDKRGGGSKVTATLPVRRRREAAPPAPRSSSNPLPTPEEARDDGTFGKEAFLRALVVELAEAVEDAEGPELAEAMVAQVGTNVGARIEDSYRAARRITRGLTPQQLADLYVELKAAIGGDFYVVEATEERIVLGNRRCPFGPVVRRQPGLCRMTSSVLGGIAARNREGAEVVLEERIALGDPECRVVVWLDGRGARPGRAGANAEPEAPDPDACLTRREREVVALIAQSLTGKEIAERLVISEKTVERHRGNILAKLGLRDRVALTRYAIRRGLIDA